MIVANLLICIKSFTELTAVCSFWGGQHLMTFDGSYYNLRGDFAFRLAASDDGSW